MAHLSDYLDAPTPVPVSLSVNEDGRLLVWPLRVRDVAEMERWATRLLGDPLAGLNSALAIGDVDERRRAMRAILGRCEGPVVRPWSEDWAVAFSGEAGRAAMLWHVMKRSFAPGWTLAEAAELASRMTADEVGAVASVAWQIDPAKVLLSRVLGADRRADDLPMIGFGEVGWLGSNLALKVGSLMKDGVPAETIMGLPLRVFLDAEEGREDDKHLGVPCFRRWLPTVSGESYERTKARFDDVFGREE